MLEWLKGRKGDNSIIDENGEEHLVDFYAKEIEGNFKIVDVSVDNRETTKKILGM